jgi:hypothetical protein
LRRAGPWGCPHPLPFRVAEGCKLGWWVRLNVAALTPHCPFYPEGLILCSRGLPPKISRDRALARPPPQGQGSPIKGSYLMPRGPNAP